MKRLSILFIVTFLLAINFISCFSTKSDNLLPLGLFEVSENNNTSVNPPIPDWKLKNSDGKYYYYYYRLTKAPQEYEDYLGSIIYYTISGNSVGNMWTKSVKELIELSLDYDDFHIFEMDNQSFIATNINLNEKPYKHVDKQTAFESEKKDIYKILTKITLVIPTW